MIRNSPVFAVCFLVLSIAGHAGGVLRWSERDVAMVEGGQEVGHARLGNSFRDIAQGSAAHVPTGGMDAPSMLEPETLASEQPTQRLTPLHVVSPMPDKSIEGLAVMPGQAISVSAKTTILASQADQRMPLRPLKTIERSQSIATLSASEPKEGEVIQELPHDVLRPSPDVTEKPVSEPKQKQSSALGAALAEQLGVSEGTRDEQASAPASNSAREDTAGNAAATNYRGLVWRKIQRNRPRASFKGTARIALSVNARGRLTSVRVLQSSGFAQFDQLLLRAVKKAAPFPKPPDGKVHSFTFDVKG